MADDAGSPPGHDDPTDLIYDEIRWSMEFQRASLASIEGKATTLMGFAGAILALLFGSLRDPSLAAAVRIGILVGVALEVLAILLASLVFWSKRLRTDPSPKTLLTRFHHRDRRETQLQVAVNRVDAFEGNQVLVERAATMLRVGMIVQLAAIVAIAVSVALLMLGF
jgi:hypothetical protein